MEVLKVNLMWLLHILFFICLLGLAGAGQESIELLRLHDTKTQHLPDEFDLPVAVSVSDSTIDEISGSVLKAETWLRNHVLSHYPRTKITTIVVSISGFCQNDLERPNNLVIVLPSLKNIYHSLTRWGLEKDIKVSPAFSYHCLNPQKSHLFRDGVFEKAFKPIFLFLQSTNSTYTINASPDFSPLSDDDLTLLSYTMHFIKKLGSLEFNKVNVINTKPMGRRKLITDPYPARPTPLPEISPFHSSIGFSAPATVAKNPKSPQPQPPPHTLPPPPSSFPLAAPPPFSFPISPQLAPLYNNPPPSPIALPPCSPYYSPLPPAAAAPAVESLWCVAKPNVPEETLQQALEFACGEGGADCDEIMPHGNCFYPDTVIAHASYAFNSYWQKTKKNGGSCTFGGTAILIAADPSFLHCRFVLS